MRLLTLSLLDTNNLPVPHLTFSVRLIATKSEPGRRETPTLPWRGAMSTLHTFWRCRVQPWRWKNPSRFILTKEGINKKNSDRLAKVFFPWFYEYFISRSKFLEKRRPFCWEFYGISGSSNRLLGWANVWNAYVWWLMSGCFAGGRLRTFTKTNSQHRQQTPSVHPQLNFSFSHETLNLHRFCLKKNCPPSLQKKSITKNTLKGVFSCFFPASPGLQQFLISFFQLHRGPQFHLSSDATQKV